METTFETVILGLGNNTGIEVPPENLAALGSSKRPPVTVTVNGYTYDSTVAVMGGRILIPLAKAHRQAAGLKAGDAAKVTLVLVAGPRQVEVPTTLQAALEAAGLGERFAELSYSKRKEYARQVNEPKTEATRERRIARVLSDLS